MATPTLIYCANRNKQFTEVAIRFGMEYGSQLPNTVYYPLYFADQDWKNPKKEAYLNAIAEHRPHMATVLDLEKPEQFNEVMGWAEEIAQYVEVIGIIPKYTGAIAQLPRKINGKEVRLCYSVPTKYGGTNIPIWEFTGWPIHLLGGSPHKQMEIAKYIKVDSVDGNYIQKMAVKWCSVWHPGTETYARNRYFPTLREMEIGTDEDAPYLAFQLSCENVVKAWSEIKW